MKQAKARVIFVQVIYYVLCILRGQMEKENSMKCRKSEIVTISHAPIDQRAVTI